MFPLMIKLNYKNGSHSFVNANTISYFGPSEREHNGQPLTDIFLVGYDSSSHCIVETPEEILALIQAAIVEQQYALAMGVANRIESDS
jgi:hypothetical protein